MHATLLRRGYYKASISSDRLFGAYPGKWSEPATVAPTPEWVPGMKQNQESREEEKKKQKGNQTDASRDGWKKGVWAEVSRPP